MNQQIPFCPSFSTELARFIPKLALDVSVKRNAFMVEMLTENEVDLVVTTHRPGQFDSL